MGMYDEVIVSMRCPYCKEYQEFLCQTKDLSRHLFRYRALNDTPGGFSKIKNTLPIFPRFPYDKSAKVWRNQLEFYTAQATVEQQFQTLKYVTVIAECASSTCRFDAQRDSVMKGGYPLRSARTFKGKIKIEKGKLTGTIVDIKKKRLKNLEKWKERVPKEYAFLMKRYKHEPLALNNWYRHYGRI